MTPSSDGLGAEGCGGGGEVPICAYPPTGLEGAALSQLAETGRAIVAAEIKASADQAKEVLRRNMG